eukprot:2141798-Prymnesium_polylepis.1
MSGTVSALASFSPAARLASALARLLRSRAARRSRIVATAAARSPAAEAASASCSAAGIRSTPA